MSVKVRVLPHANVMGLTAGQEIEIQPTEELEFYIRWGHVEVLDDLGPPVED